MNRSFALELAGVIADHLHANVDDPAPLVTLNADEAVNAVAAGIHACLINPPRLEFDTRHHATATWTLTLVPGSADRDTSWTEADELLEALRHAVDVDTVDPIDWKPDGAPIPLVAYRVTITTDHDL